MNITNLLSDLPDSLPEEMVDVLLESRTLRIERIISTGHCSADEFWYDQNDSEWVLLLQGAATLQFQDQADPVDLWPGDCITIASHRKHRVHWTSPETPTVWLAVFVATD